jgi:hypothetical protein
MPARGGAYGHAITDGDNSTDTADSDNSTGITDGDTYERARGK